LVLLGDASFSFYVIHQLFIRAANVSGMVAEIWTAALTLVISVAILLYKQFELPVKARTTAFPRRLLPGAAKSVGDAKTS
jgi:peptidoglycan/LPS O-acetylase OafA/YrhL